MKTQQALLLILILLPLSFLTAQSSITSITVFPANPTDTDTIYIYAELMFPSSGCELDYKDHNVTGYTISASTLHCLSALSTICYTVDTFKAGQLTSGTYTFSLSLSSGMAPAPCTPGIVPDDSDSLTFVVSASSSINTADNNEILLYPNPVSGRITFNKPLKNKSFLYNSTGELIMEISVGVHSVDLSVLKPGLYYLKHSTKCKKLMIF